jgi:hypothetical protein
LEHKRDFKEREREREKNESGLKISRSQIGRSDVASLALFGP